MSQMPRRVFPHAFTNSIPALGACAMLLTLTGCTELARFIGKADSKPAEPVVAEQTTSEQTTSEQTEERVEGPVEKPKPSKLYEWNGDGRKVSRIVIDTDKQRASFFVGEDEIGWSTIASGLPKHPTPTGKFAVMEKVENKRSNLYGKVVKNGKVVRSNAKAGRDAIPAGASFEGARMPYFMRLTYDGIGLHAGPIPRPGRPASHGCIRLPSTLAPVLFKHVSHGTEVTIVGSGPSYGDYVAKQRIAAERAKREAEQRRIAQANAAEAAPSAEPSPAVASATPHQGADARPDQQAAATPPTEPPTASGADVPATDPATAPTGSAVVSAPETSTASAAPRDPSPTSGATAVEVTTAPAAAMDSPESAPRTVAEPAASPEQADTQPRPAGPPENKTTTIAETAGSVDDANPPARSSTQAAPASDPAPAPGAQPSPPSTGSEASQAPAPAAPPAEPAAPPAQAQQTPAAAAEGSEG
jgi:lipoprotein-anchoring transpeptidase ErfK/SrfK